MKGKSKLITGLVIVVTFVVGFVSGILIEYPKVDSENIRGTIGRVNNYRNVKVSEEDIELKNDLVTNKDLQKSMRTYMSFYYSKSIESARTITFTLNQAKAIPALNLSQEKQDGLGKFVQFLEESRKDLLQAVIACQFIDELNPVELRNTFDQANNIIARMNQANPMILDLIEQLDGFILKSGATSYPELNRAHDLLVYNQIGASILSKDKTLIKYLDKKRLFAENIQTNPIDVKAVISGDMEKLNGMTYFDLEKLAMWDKEKLAMWDNEKLGAIEMDMEKLGSLWDIDKLSAAYCDKEQLGIMTLDTEKLGITSFDAEQLNVFVADKEDLGIFSQEQLANCLW